MQKLIILILALISSGLVWHTGYAEDQKVYTSEMVPGGNCVCVMSPTTPNDDNGNKNSDIK